MTQTTESKHMKAAISSSREFFAFPKTGTIIEGKVIERGARAIYFDLGHIGHWSIVQKRVLRSSARHERGRKGQNSTSQTSLS